MDPSEFHLPDIDGELDANYLVAALKRGGRSSRVGSLTVSPLLGGLSSADVLSIRDLDAGRFVLKKLKHDEENWWAQLVGSQVFEVELWAKGITRNLPYPISTPTIDIAFHVERREWWILMEDVSDYVITRLNFDAEKFSWLLDGLARFHAKYCNPSAIEHTRACPLDRHVEIFAEPVLAAAGRTEAHGWVKQLASKPMFASNVPAMTNVYHQSGFDFYLDLCQHRGDWLRPLLEFPQTLLHGDLYFRHVALKSSERVLVFDWNLPVRGPPAADLAWCWFLNFWCFPPKADLLPMDVEPLRVRYLELLQEAADGAYGRDDLERSWHLSWLKAFVQLGWCMAKPAVLSNDTDALRHARTACQRIVDQANWVVDTYVS